MRFYILDGHKAAETDLMTWIRWVTGINIRRDESLIVLRRVARDTVGCSDISTVFLGLDYSFGHGRPLLFETMVFGGELNQEMYRYSTWEQAQAGHKKMVEKVKSLKVSADGDKKED